MRYILNKACNEIIAATITIILLIGNLISCSPRKPDSEKPSSTPGNTTYSEATTTYAEDTVTYAEKTQTYAEDMIMLSEDMITYTEDVTYYIEDMVFYEFGEYVDDMYVIVLHTQDYIDKHTVIYDPETGREFKFGPVLAKIAVGTAVIIACVALTVATGGTAAQSIPFILKIAIPYVQVAKAGAATGAAISGAISYITSGGNLEETFYGAIEGAADGFMWGAILSPGAVKLAKLQLGKATAPIRETASYKNFSQIAREGVRKISSKADDIIRPVLRSEVSKQILSDIEDYSRYGYHKINGVLRGIINDPAISPTIRAQAARISNFLKSRPLLKNKTLFRGEHLKYDDLAKNYGLENVRGKSTSELVDMINNSIKNGKTIQRTEPAFTSTSTELEKTAGFATNWGNPKMDHVIIRREIQTGSKGVTGANITELVDKNVSHELETLLDTNLRTKVIGAYKRTVRDDYGKVHEVLYIVEQAL